MTNEKEAKMDEGPDEDQDMQVVDGDESESSDDDDDDQLDESMIVTWCVYKNDHQRLSKCFQDDQDPYKAVATEQLNVRDANGKAPLDLAAQLGHLEITKELLARGAAVSAVTDKGYNALHHAAAWGRLDILKALVEAGGDVQQRTAHGERPRETATRYAQTHCLEFLAWAEAKHALVELIRTVQERVNEAGVRVSKEDKSLAAKACRDKTDWLESAQDPSRQDFVLQRDALDEVVAPIMARLAVSREQSSLGQDAGLILTRSDELRKRSRQRPKLLSKGKMQGKGEE